MGTRENVILSYSLGNTFHKPITYMFYFVDQIWIVPFT